MHIAVMGLIGYIGYEFVEHIVLYPAGRAAIRILDEKDGGTNMEITREEMKKGFKTFAQGLLQETKAELGGVTLTAKNLVKTAGYGVAMAARTVVSATPLTTQASSKLLKTVEAANERLKSAIDEGRSASIHEFDSNVDTVKSVYNSSKEWIQSKFKDEDAVQVEKKPATVRGIQAARG